MTRNRHTKLIIWFEPKLNLMKCTQISFTYDILLTEHLHSYMCTSAGIFAMRNHDYIIDNLLNDLYERSNYR